MAVTLDLNYVLSRPFGILRTVQVVLCVIILICLGLAELPLSGTAFIWFTSVSSLISSLVALCLYVVHLTETGPFVRIPWYLGEFILCAIWSLFHAISGIIAAVSSSRVANVPYFRSVHGAFAAASFFCFVAAIAYGLCAYFFYQNWRSSSVPEQGQRRTVTITTTAATTSRY